MVPETLKLSETPSYLANTQSSTAPQVVTKEEDICGEDCQKTIEEKISEAIAGLPQPTSEPIIQPQTQTTANQTSYISMGGETSSTSTDWYDVPGSEVTFNLVNDYSSAAKVTFEASLKVAHANGTAYVRLFDDTHKIAVNASELMVVNSDSYVYKISENLSLWSGTNTYKVQLKSLNGFQITVDNPRLKISY